MDFIDSLRESWPFIAIFITILKSRNWICSKLNNSKIGTYLMLPIMGPYVIWGLYKLYNDQDFLKLIESVNRQKRISDYF